MTSIPSTDLTIAGRPIGSAHPAFIIAEIGINHGGDEARCVAMIEAAAQGGADAAKLQIVDADASYHPETASYSAFSGMALPRDALLRQMALADRLGIILFATPGDLASLALMIEVGMPAIKISSGLLTNTPLIRAAAQTGKPLILSTGMAEMGDIDAALAAAGEGGCRELALLQCTSLYPAPPDALNLRAIETLRRHYAVPVGYSDHHDGTLAVIAAVAAGADLIEKHFTLDRSEAGADHALSLEPEAFARMVRDIRAVEAMLGRDEKAPVEAEIPLRDGRHRMLAAARDLRQGDILAVEDVLLMRLPAGHAGLPAYRLDGVVGRKVRRPVAHLGGLTADNLDFGE